jgi:hypothetical protein
VGGGLRRPPPVPPSNPVQGQPDGAQHWRWGPHRGGGVELGGHDDGRWPTPGEAHHRDGPWVVVVVVVVVVRLPARLALLLLLLLLPRSQAFLRWRREPRAWLNPPGPPSMGEQGRWWRGGRGGEPRVGLRPPARWRSWGGCPRRPLSPRRREVLGYAREGYPVRDDSPEPTPHPLQPLGANAARRGGRDHDEAAIAVRHRRPMRRGGGAHRHEPGSSARGASPPRRPPLAPRARSVGRCGAEG